MKILFGKVTCNIFTILKIDTLALCIEILSKRKIVNCENEAYN